MKGKVKKIRQETHDTKNFSFACNETLHFTPGQFVMLTCELRDGPGFVVRNDKKRTQKRSYSIASAPGESGFDLCIKKEPEGFVSDFLCTVVQEGEEFQIAGPFGKFLFEDTMKNVVLIAAGSGIAPMRSIMKHVIIQKLNTKIDLFYSNKTPEDICYRDELLGMVSTSINVHLTVTRPQLSNTQWNGTTGRITAQMVQEKVGLEGKYFFLCGPPALVKDIRQQLLNSGVDNEQIKIEAW